MANHGYMTITGKSQGLISGGCAAQDSIGNKCQSGHTDEIMVLSYSHNMSNIGDTSTPTHGPIVITKNIDKSSLLLSQALSRVTGSLNEQSSLLSQSWEVAKKSAGAIASAMQCKF